MPNICFGSINVKGLSMNVDEFTNILNADYNYNTMVFSHVPHFARIFEVDIVSEETYGIFKQVEYNIECAWSIAVCMENGPWSYYESLKAEFKEKFNGTTLKECARRLGLFIEIFSEEEAMEFNEYYMYNNLGIKFKDECLDTRQYDLNNYKSADDFCEKTGDYISKEDFEYYTEEYEGYYSCNAIDPEPFINNMQFAINPIVIKKVETGE